MDIGTSATGFFVCSQPFPHAPFTNYITCRSVNYMSCRDYTFFEFYYSEAIHRFAGLLQGESVALRPVAETVVFFVKYERDSAVQAGHRQCNTTDAATDDGHIWKFFAVGNRKHF